jgi:hypothetical protein
MIFQSTGFHSRLYADAASSLARSSSGKVTAVYGHNGHLAIWVFKGAEQTLTGPSFRILSYVGPPFCPKPPLGILCIIKAI